MRRYLCFIFLSFLASLFRAQPAPLTTKTPQSAPTQLAQLTASDAASNNYFGYATATDGVNIFIGAYGHNNNAGVVYLFTSSASSWQQQAELTAPSPAANDQFGYSVAIGNGTLVIGATGRNGSGAVFVFTDSGGTWTQQAVLTASDAASGDMFGFSVAISGNTIVVGAPAKATDQGAAYVFTRVGSTWTQQAELTDTSATEEAFGFSVALDGGTAVIGAPNFKPAGAGSNAASAGSAFVFTQSGAIWTEQAQLTPSDSEGFASFGHSVAVSGTTILGGAPTLGDRGKVFVFSLSGSTWSQQTTLTRLPPSEYDPDPIDTFGTSVAFNGSTVVIGAPDAPTQTCVGCTTLTGAIYVYELLPTNVWVRRSVIFSPDTPNSGFGNSVAIAGGVMLSGEPFGAITANTSPTGLAYVYQVPAWNVALLSNPAGRSFTLSNTGCGADDSGTFLAPYFGLWTNCTVTWTTPDTATANTEYTFQNWFDGNSTNQRTFTPPALPATSVVSADFLTLYQLSVAISPSGAGTVTGGGFYPAGSTATVTATASDGYALDLLLLGPTTISGAQGGVVMNEPVYAQAFFIATAQPAILKPLSSVYANGPTNAEILDISMSNTNISDSVTDLQLIGLTLTQVAGAPCTPFRVNPVAFPVWFGVLTAGNQINFSPVYDFSSCSADALFSASIGYAASGGSIVGQVQLPGRVRAQPY